MVPRHLVPSHWTQPLKPTNIYNFHKNVGQNGTRTPCSFTLDTTPQTHLPLQLIQESRPKLYRDTLFPYTGHGCSTHSQLHLSHESRPKWYQDTLFLHPGHNSSNPLTFTTFTCKKAIMVARHLVPTPWTQLLKPTYLYNFHM